MLNDHQFLVAAAGSRLSADGSCILRSHYSQIVAME
jgi:hypothetical protein